MVPVVCVSISLLLKKANPVSCPRTFAGEAPVVLQLLGLIQLGELEGAQLALWVSQAAIQEGWQRGQSTRRWKRKRSDAVLHPGSGCRTAASLERQLQRHYGHRPA